jgi:Colicin E5 ribonuclease domain
MQAEGLARRRQTKFMPADFKLIEARQPPLKDSYDEWLARLICYAFSVPVSAFVSQVNRATGETLRQQATQEGLIPLKAWVKNALDHVICVCMNEPGLEFVWVGDDAVDPLEQAQTLQILVGAGIKTREEARADLGLAPAGGAAPGKPQAKLGKFNPNHSRITGQFTSADDPDAQPTETSRVELAADKEDAKTPAGFKLNAKALRRMQRRGWTPEQIDEAVKSGNRIDAQNKANGNPATRYVNPTTGKSVVIDNVTNSVIQVGRDDFDYSVESGDLPGAVMRPPSGTTGLGGGGGGGSSDPFRHNPGLVPDEEEPLY